ncbi:enzyme of heme biosynthesis [Halomonadaceae bacterium LMG 33818]|uniref:uroporphyrinogen-III C-methyltransferase n=1 Tax=Cernens ardua TaxID=3402176 RepID=UPI003EDC2430
MSTKDDDKQISANETPAGSESLDAKKVSDADKTAVSSKASSIDSATSTNEAAAVKSATDKDSAIDTGDISSDKRVSPVMDADNADKHSTDAGTKEKSGKTFGTPSSPGLSSSLSEDPDGSTVAGNGGGKGTSGSSNTADAPKSHEKRNVLQVLLVVLIILVILVLLGLGWNLQRMNQQHDSVSQLDARISHLEQQSHDQIQQALSDGQQSNQQLTQRMDQNDQTVQKVLTQLNRHQQTSPSDWTYAEVEYLLRIANQRLALQRDVAGAQHLLNLADQRLASTQNPAFIPVRGAIHNELADLDSVNAVDTDGIYLQLNAEQQQFNTLPLAQDTQALSAKEDNSASFSGGWRSQLGRLGNQLEDLVTIRHHDKPLEALITPRQEGYLRANISLLLEQAQIALLNQDENVYKGSLNQALNLINQYYEVHDGGVEKATQHIQSLAQVNVRPKLPDISGSLNQLQSILSQRGSASNSNQGE